MGGKGEPEEKGREGQVKVYDWRTHTEAHRGLQAGHQRMPNPHHPLTRLRATFVCSDLVLAPPLLI